MPPKLKTTSPERRVRWRVCVINPGSSPKYSHQSSFSPRTARIPISLAKCWSSRLPRRISSPMMIAPIPISNPRRIALDRLAAQLTQPIKAVVDERQPAEYRHEQPDHGYVPDEREHDSQKEQLTAETPHHVGDFCRVAMLGERIVAEHPLIEETEQQYR